MKKASFILLVCTCFLSASFKVERPGSYTYQIARMKYKGGGNWYVSPTSLPNLIAFCNKNLGMNMNPQEAQVEPGGPEIFNYPMIHISGNGNILFTPEEAENLRNYLIGGGFLEVNDSYGMDSAFRRELRKVFPELKLVELPFSHPIYHQKYDFPHGLPKIHEHDGGRATGWGLIYNGRLVCFYNYDCDLGDGWEDSDVYNDPPELHEKALEMGANLVQYIMMGQIDNAKKP
ncbi:MAG TPA: DUF4159 domain-containing protein [Bacteroidia bacterium]|jgi:hypothetical protein|nr:DUF4159 domain-containing protein [Bacteroidia bacterium]